MVATPSFAAATPVWQAVTALSLSATPPRPTGVSWTRSSLRLKEFPTAAASPAWVVTSGPDVLSHMNQLENGLCARVALLELMRGTPLTPRPSLTSYYTPGSGNFTVDSVNNFLLHYGWTRSRSAPCHLEYISDFMNQGSISPQLLSTLLPPAGYPDAFILSTNNGLGQCNAVALKRVRDAWHLLDSEAEGGPRALDSPRQWRRLSGKIISFVAGSVRTQPG